MSWSSMVIRLITLGERFSDEDWRRIKRKMMKRRTLRKEKGRGPSGQVKEEEKGEELEVYHFIRGC